MVRDNALTLSDLKTPTLRVVCALCGRRGLYPVGALRDQHGDAKLTEPLYTIADCPNSRSTDAHTQCRAMFEELGL